MFSILNSFLNHPTFKKKKENERKEGGQKRKERDVGAEGEEIPTQIKKEKKNEMYGLCDGL